MVYKNNILIKACTFVASVLLTGVAFGQARPNIIPRPVKAINYDERFIIKQNTVLLFDNHISPKEQGFYKKVINVITGTTISAKPKAVTNYISLTIDSSQIKQTEGYILDVKKDHISIIGHNDAGVFYGLQSLTQLIQHSAQGVLSVPGCTIEDYPRFGYRGTCLDVSRHMFPVSAIKKWINILALYKINTFHWHLTDDQGWRIEIKKYPELQTIAAYRKETLIGHKKEEPHRFDGKRYGGYYTQEEIKDIVAFAAQRHINIIPEIEMPGHSLAALTAYPNLGCTGGPYQTATYWGIFDDVYCAGNEETFTFLQNVLDEVISLFPSKYIHIGGDECPKTRWQTCPKCQQRIKDEHLKDEHELQSYFVNRIEKYLNSKNRQIIGWDEILEGGLSPGATVMSWTGEQGGIAAVQQHHNAIMTPEKYVYLDYYQSLYPEEPLAAGGYNPLSKIYGYEPIPKELSTEESRYIKGVQANEWSEYLPSIQQAEYMMFPRVLALAEIAWSAKADRNYPDFLNRLHAQQPLLKKLNINAANNYDEITDVVSRDTTGKIKLALHATLPEATIRYTSNGSTPNINSKAYANPLTIATTSTIKAVVFTQVHQYGRVYQKYIQVHKAIGKAVTLVNQPAGNYNPGNITVLVDGIEGSNLYNDGQWFGFSGNDLDAVIDLGAAQRITQIGTNILKYHWQKMWEPAVLNFFVSSDGKNYQEVYQQKEFPLNGINHVRAKITPVTARYIKITAINKGIIPKGEYGAGGKAWLLTDEFIVN
jgi:hexosaminidase